MSKGLPQWFSRPFLDMRAAVSVRITAVQDSPMRITEAERASVLDHLRDLVDRVERAAGYKDEVEYTADSEASAARVKLFGPNKRFRLVEYTRGPRAGQFVGSDSDSAWQSERLSADAVYESAAKFLAVSGARNQEAIAATRRGEIYSGSSDTPTIKGGPR